jgi:hypothetical protein
MGESSGLGAPDGGTQGRPQSAEKRCGRHKEKGGFCWITAWSFYYLTGSERSQRELRRIARAGESDPEIEVRPVVIRGDAAESELRLSEIICYGSFFFWYLVIDSTILELCIHIGIYRFSNIQFTITAHHGQMAPIGRKR